jgi:alkaline phosphatase isozyme conversion protein
VLAVEAVSDKKNKASEHDIRLDNQQHIDKAQPGRIERRTRDIVRIMLPLVKELAKAGK